MRQEREHVDQTAEAAEFEKHRTHLMGVAYRMLGSMADAEDVVQEAYVRFTGAAWSEIRDVRAWLTTAVGRLCLDELGSARARRESYVGPWLPEPVVGAAREVYVSPVGLGPEDRVSLDESVSMAMLVVLEALSPAERTAFVLHEVLGLSYGEVAAAVGRSEAACRQLTTRARRHVRDRAPRFTPDRDEHESVVTAFLTACSRGSVDELVLVLDPDVVLRSDGGGVVPGVARRPVTGSNDVARLILGVAAKYPAMAYPLGVNGASGLVFEAGGVVVGVMGFSVARSRVTEIDFVLNPEKLKRATHR
jgi:RNA polymerase sigma-70 factor (ECF subfamily)